MATIRTNTGGSLQWIVDDAAGLAAVVINQNELGKVAFQDDTKQVWMAKGVGSGAANWKLTGDKFRTGIAQVSLTDGASIAWDMSQGNLYTVTLGGNRTLAAPTNYVIGETYYLEVVQDATAGRTLAYNAVYYAAGGAITVTAAAEGDTDVLKVTCVSATKFVVTQQDADISALA